MEQEFIIDTTDGQKIYGLLKKVPDNQKLVIFVHGLSGSMTEAHYYAAKQYFTQQGYNVCRFNLYSSGEKARLLHTSTIAQHVEDIKTILFYFSSGFKDIYVVGHSLGGPSIIGIEKIPQNLRRIVLWDPAFDTSSTLLKCNIENGIYLYKGNGKNVQISQEMYHELQENSHLETLKKMPFDKENIKIIYASEARHKDMVTQIQKLGITYSIIEGTNHGFTQEGKYEELFARTSTFLEA